MLTDVIDVEVTLQGASVIVEGFGVALLLSCSATWAERQRSYTNIDGVADDFAVNSYEYLMAQKTFAQTPSVASIVIGRCANVPTIDFHVGVFAAGAGSKYSLRVAAKNGSAWASQQADYTPATLAAWTATHAYTAGQQIQNSGNGYECITSGTSAGSGGPTTTAADITDGSAHWKYMGAVVSGTANDVIVEGLRAAVDALAAPVVSGVGAHQVTTSLTGSAGALQLRILANTAGDFYGVEPLDLKLLTLVQDEADPGVVADLTAIANESDAFYGVVTPFASLAIIEATAAWIETNHKIYNPASQDTAIPQVADGSATDVAHALKASAYTRTMIFFHPANDEFADAAEYGRFLPVDPGSDNWTMKPLTGVSAKNYTATHVANMTAKHVNWYSTLGGAPVIRGFGLSAAGGNNYLDVVRGIDWYVARLSEREVVLLIQNNKIPYTNPGIRLLANELKAQNSDGIAAGVIAPDPAPVVSIPDARQVSSADKTARTLNNLNTTWYTAGAIDKIKVNVAVLA